MNTQSVENTQNEVNVEFLQAFNDAWNNHDIDALMSFVTDDCVFHTVAGPELQGSTISGRDAVRDSFQQVWKNFPDAAWLDGEHFISGDRAVSESTFSATKPDGSKIEARMVDVFTLKGGKIQVKNAFRKDRPAFFESN
ncbi:nuclear transport factor 2 family protein [Photobacterium sanctipauli]|uniref:Nuclear transport factor 2 family protein n=1 Tax=Photobacterium sanctipauli TaxID=1342794 RepID=A0A2T3NZN5_9GAMM|nr:nuclear transport factor 2 family protein [Photobacterium sanctipauli]PSW21724.1 nuclear transport factor 2 family protein [Photobacterium sanctipauli]